MAEELQPLCSNIDGIFEYTRWSSRQYGFRSMPLPATSVKGVTSFAGLVLCLEGLQMDILNPALAAALQRDAKGHEAEA